MSYHSDLAIIRQEAAAVTVSRRMQTYKSQFIEFISVLIVKRSKITARVDRWSVIG